jgi:hypothetical protein
MPAKMTPQSTKSGGRKIDTWSVEMPDKEKYEVIVNMITDQSGTVFNASCGKGLLRHLFLSSPEINTLRDLVREEADRVAEEFLGATWVKAFKVTTTQSKRAPREASGFGLSLNWSPLRVDRSQAPSNTGELRILQSGSPYLLRQRGHRDVFDAGGNDSLLRKMKLRENEGESVAIVDATEDTCTRLKEMREMFLLFNDLLLTRMSPDEIGRRDIPQLDDPHLIFQNPGRSHLPSTERWPSGRRRTPGKCVGGKPSRGFESLSLRQTPEFTHNGRLLL